MTDATEAKDALEATPGPPAGFHPGGLREITRLELAPELLAAVDPLLEGLAALVERAGVEAASPDDELAALAGDAAAVAEALRTVEEHLVRSTLDQHEHALARTAGRAARKLDAVVAELVAATGPLDRSAAEAASLRETYLLRLPDAALREGLRWIVAEVHGTSLEEGRAAYEPTMVTAYCRAAGRELRYLAARLLDVSAETWAERAHAAGRVCAALVEELASAGADREPAEVLV